MLQQHISNISFESFQAVSQGKKVIILYPWTSYRNLFLSYFLSEPEEGLIYYRIPRPCDKLTVWLNEMLEELQVSLDHFGSHLKAALPNGKPEALGQALAADLGQVNSKQVLFYLDELDQVPQDTEFRAFIKALVAALPAQVRLVVNSRVLTYQPWIEMVNQGDTAILGTAFRRNDLMFTRTDGIHPQLEVYGFGRGHALVNGQEVDNWDGALPRNLFFYFMDNEMTTRNEIFTVFWPKLSVKEATNVFHVTKRKITERISTNVLEKGNYELTTYSGGFYRPGSKVIRHYDVADFIEALEQTLMTDDEAKQEALYQRAIDIYKAPFLQTIDMPWVLERREKLRQMFVDALIDMGRLKKRQEKWDYALGFFVRALKETPQREDIYREVMMMYANLGRVEDAMEQYRQLEDHLNRTVGVPPSRETRELADRIKNSSR